MNRHGSGLLLGGDLLSKNSPRDVVAQVFAADLPLRHSLDEGTALSRNLPVPAKPLADGGLLYADGRSESGLTPEATDGAFNGIHSTDHRHCRCLLQGHWLLQALPVEIRPMHTGSELGQALRQAMKLKDVTQATVAKEFGITQPSVSEWLKFGRIGKHHITRLVTFFADVVPPEHWGLPPTWAGVPQPVAQAGPPPAPPANFADPHREASDSDWQLLDDLKWMPHEDREAVKAEVRAKAEKWRKHTQEMIEQFNKEKKTS